MPKIAAGSGILLLASKNLAFLLRKNRKNLLARSRLRNFTARFEEPCLFASQKRKIKYIAQKGFCPIVCKV